MKENRLSIASNNVIEAGNEIYRVFVIDTGSFAGLYTAMTGPGHPEGAGLNVLYGDGSPGTTYNTIRSYTSETDYVQESTLSTFSTVLLGPFGTTTLIGTTGVRTTYILPGPPVTPDALIIISEVNVSGTTFENSAINVITTITNPNPNPLSAGIRYEWDYQIGADDGPTFQTINPEGEVLTTETQFDSPAFEMYRIEDNDVNPNPPTFNIYGTVTGPAEFKPTPPDLLQYVSWPNAVSQAFEYTINPELDIATIAGGINDSAVLHFFGHNQENAITIPGVTSAGASLANAENSVTVSSSLILAPPGPLPFKSVTYTRIVSDARTGTLSITLEKRTINQRQILGGAVS